MAKNSSGTSTLADGLLIPRVDRQRAVNMTSVEPSTLIYVNSIATGNATGQGSNIDSIGFYYFDETTSKWSKLITPVGDPTPDAFVDDSANAMVKLGATSSGSARAAGSEFVIKDAGNVGVGTSTPAQKLEVNGNVKFNAVPNASSVDNTDRIMVLQSDGTGKKVPLTSLQPPNTYTPRGIFRYQAPNPALYALNTSYPTTTIINNIDIGYNTFTVYIPPNTSSLILFNYSIPNGLTDSTGDNLNLNTSGTVYQGIRFLKAGVEEPSGSRKFLQTGVSCLAGIYSETIDNPTSSQIAIVFSLHGYLEIVAGTNFPSGSFARFNMNKAVGANFNWGKGILTLQQFDKPL
ncbi:MULTISPECIES: hypothetical protein [unclassified Chryseobacterium]|uniref:hypothetical protein n=1 Tax=unclassified Chryseobacterium TaxID=2593645 RepID=UPI00300FEC8F